MLPHGDVPPNALGCHPELPEPPHLESGHANREGGGHPQASHEPGPNMPRSTGHGRRRPLCGSQRVGLTLVAHSYGTSLYTCIGQIVTYAPGSTRNL